MRTAASLLLASLAAVGTVATVSATPALAATTSPTSTATSPVAAPNSAAGTDITVTLPEGRSYILFRPAKPSARPGLVVALHHYAGNAAGFELHTNLDAGAGNTGNYVAYPESGQQSWNAGACCASALANQTDDVTFLDHVIDDVQARTGVAEGRVAMTGFSNGGMMSYRYSCERPTRAPLIIPDGATAVTSCNRTAPVSVVAVHGALDTAVPWAGGTSTSPVLTGVSVPSIPSVIGGAAALDHCTGGFVQDKTPRGQDRWTAQGCPANVMVSVIRSAALAHYWPTGSADVATYGVDTSSIVWSMAAGRWATT